MIDPAITLASAIATALSPYLVEAAKAAAKKIGEATIGEVGKLYQTLKKRLTKPAEKEILAKLEAEPENSKAQAALRQLLEERLAAHPNLYDELAGFVNEILIRQEAHITGNQNFNVQIAGSGNIVKG